VTAWPQKCRPTPLTFRVVPADIFASLNTGRRRKQLPGTGPGPLMPRGRVAGPGDGLPPRSRVRQALLRHGCGPAPGSVSRRGTGASWCPACGRLAHPRVRGGRTSPVLSRTHPAGCRPPATPLRRQRPGQADRAVHRLQVCGTYRVPHRLAAGRRSALRIAVTPGVPPIRACRCGGPVADQRPGPGPRDWPGGTSPAADQSRSGQSAQCCAGLREETSVRPRPVPL